MDGNKMVTNLKRLSNIKTIKDVTQLTYALFPGAHCPLMGAALAVRGIEDAMIMVIGTDECAYYTKSLTMTEAFGGVKGRCVSTILETYDVTFGSVEKVERAFDEMVKEYQPGCVFLVTTCVVEIIGDDMDALASALTEKHGIPTYAVHTEHFKCEDHIPGVERTITACIELMEEQPITESVNILGQRLGKFVDTEVYTILKEQGVEIGMMLPSGCTVEEIKQAPRAKVNIVVNDTALTLAKKMKRQFGTPYVVFDKYVAPDRIYKAYQTLFDHLEIAMPKSLEIKYEETTKMMESYSQVLEGATYIYGNTPFMPYEFNLFMMKLGMKAELIQMSRYKEEDKRFVQEMLELQNPYVTKSANIAPLQYVYDVLQPDLYLGHEYAMRLRKKGIALVRSDKAWEMLGFELTTFILEQLKESYEASKGYKEALVNGTM